VRLKNLYGGGYHLFVNCEKEVKSNRTNKKAESSDDCDIDDTPVKKKPNQTLNFEN
jgi:hypothetical protein